MSVSVGSQSATVSRVATSTSAATLFSATGLATSRIICNDSAVVLFVKFGTAASSTDYTMQIAAGATTTLTKPTYSGVITGTLASGTGNAQCTSY